MNIQIKQLFATYEQSKVLVAEHTYMQQSFATVQINPMPILWCMGFIMQEKAR